MNKKNIKFFPNDNHNKVIEFFLNKIETDENSKCISWRAGAYKQISILTSDCDYCYFFNGISKETGLAKNEVRKSCRFLARKGILQFRRGLFNEDCETSGSGYTIKTLLEIPLPEVRFAEKVYIQDTVYKCCSCEKHFWDGQNVYVYKFLLGGDYGFKIDYFCTKCVKKYILTNKDKVFSQEFKKEIDIKNINATQ